MKRSCIIDETWSLEHMHSFALSTVHELLQCNVMQHLESISDVASKTQYQDSPRKEDTKDIIVKKMKTTYDPIKLLRVVGKHAGPDHESLPENPKLHELKSLVTRIPADRLEKIRLKLSPDRLSNLINR